MPFTPHFTITDAIAADLTQIERARGFLEAAALPEPLIREMGRRALVLEAHHTTHIEGTRLTFDQAQKLRDGQNVPEADPEDARELLNYRGAFELVSDAPHSIGLSKTFASRRPARPTPGNATSSTVEGERHRGCEKIDFQSLRTQYVRGMNHALPVVVRFTHPIIFSQPHSVRQRAMTSCDILP
ncbi:MAG: hypothetical protein GX594_04475 [Pirellulaceae bacterium]|nr:hypothetical protein [Pirellulaceae bacterium]